MGESVIPVDLAVAGNFIILSFLVTMREPAAVLGRVELGLLSILFLKITML
jgi:hypothetical protein